MATSGGMQIWASLCKRKDGWLLKCVPSGAEGGSTESAIHKVAFDEMTPITKAIWDHLGHPHTRPFSRGKATVFRGIVKQILLEAGGYESHGG